MLANLHEADDKQTNLDTMAAAFRAYTLRKLLKNIPKFKMSRNVSTTSPALAEAVENLKTNPYYDKYAQKIAKLQKQSPEEFLSRIEASISSKKVKADKSKLQNPIPSGTAKPILDNKPRLTKQKLLNDYMKTDLLEDANKEDIQKVWLDFHKDKDVIAAVIPKETYQVLYNRGKEFTTFLLPLPRHQGYEFIVCQFYGHEVHFTPLIAYQTHKENAPECLAVVHYTELAETKGIVLMKADYNTDMLQAHEAQCLINELQLYYAQNNEKRLKMLHRFTYAPNEFKHMDLIADMECLTI